MKSITIPESEYLRLIQTIKELKAEVASLKSRFLKPEIKPETSPKQTESPFKRLKGVIQLPADFDHKDFLGDELLAAYLSK
ncbi:MAG: hypothetical protein H6577_10150 [Lewinellaceae bacterium]|nr:hypothetical protein [Saprospiraceae bacterium]MCB9338478.1 hypothetical protein [Lewinellaceae bacterium]